MPPPTAPPKEFFRQPIAFNLDNNGTADNEYGPPEVPPTGLNLTGVLVLTFSKESVPIVTVKVSGAIVGTANGPQAVINPLFIFGGQTLEIIVVGGKAGDDVEGSIYGYTTEGEYGFPDPMPPPSPLNIASYSPEVPTVPKQSSRPVRASNANQQVGMTTPGNYTIIGAPGAGKYLELHTGIWYLGTSSVQATAYCQDGSANKIFYLAASPNSFIALPIDFGGFVLPENSAFVVVLNAASTAANQHGMSVAYNIVS